MSYEAQIQQHHAEVTTQANAELRGILNRLSPEHRVMLIRALVRDYNVPVVNETAGAWVLRG